MHQVPEGAFTFNLRRCFQDKTSGYRSSKFQTDAILDSRQRKKANLRKWISIHKVQYKSHLFPVVQLSVHLLNTSPLFHHSSPSFHFPGFTALERQTVGRCTCSLNRHKEVLTSSPLSSRHWLPLAAPLQKFQKSHTSSVICAQFILFSPSCVRSSPLRP